MPIVRKSGLSGLHSPGSSLAFSVHGRFQARAARGELYMRKFGDESGQTLVMVALSMAVLLGFAAFATDVGVMLDAKRHVQSAADSAAIAAAWGLSQNTGAVATGT